MSRSDFILKEGALLISDAHYDASRPGLLELLRAIDSGRIEVTQLILMGDIFDLLFGCIPITQQRNREVIERINTLSNTVEILYLEGNHDFQLQDIFPKLHVIPITQQPFTCKFEDKKIALAHGDYRGDWKYRLYLNVIRSRIMLKTLNFIDTISSHSIISWLDNYLKGKDDCSAIEAFERLIASHQSLFESYGCDYIIEGHFHQNVTLTFENFKYINVGAFACNQRYFIVQSPKKQKLLQEVFFNKENV
jgi:UDP-2,3-diacylglucosamine hydrolase